MLIKDCGEVGLGHVGGEGSIAEDACGVAGGRERLVPGDNALRERLNVVAGEACEQHLSADAITVWRRILRCSPLIPFPSVPTIRPRSCSSPRSKYSRATYNVHRLSSWP